MRPAPRLFRALNFGLLRHLQGVVDLDPQVLHGAFQLGMAYRSCTARTFFVRR
jgi:hypothetical protein